MEILYKKTELVVALATRSCKATEKRGLEYHHIYEFIEKLEPCDMLEMEEDIFKPGN
jgi:guanylate kinase